MNIEITFAEITLYFSWTIALYTAFLYRKLPKQIKIFGFWLIVSPLLVIYPQYLANQGQHNLFWRHVINHFDFVSLSFFYFYLFFNSKRIRIILLTCLGLYIGFSVFSTLTFETWAVYPATMAFVSNSFIILFALLYYYQLYKEERILYLEKDGLFIINSGLFLYNMSTLFIYLALNHLTFKTPLSTYIFFDNIDCTIFILSKLLLARALWILATHTQREPSYKL